MTDNDKTTVAASYIIDFYQLVNQLLHHTAQYINVLKEMEQKEGKIDDNEKYNLARASQLVSYYLNVIHPRYIGLCANLNEKPSPTAVSLFKKMDEQYIIHKEDIRKYCEEMNTSLLSQVIKTLLETSQQIVSNIYQE